MGRLVPVAAMMSNLAAVVGDVVLQARFFGVCQPAGVARLVLEIEVEDQTQNAGGRALDEKQPLPAMQTVDAIHIFENGAAQGAGRNRHGHDG